VRSDCAPQTLQEFLTSDTADEADSTSLSLYSQEDEEAALLAEVRFLLHSSGLWLLSLSRAGA
jgi:hypothetical protein